MQVFEFQSGVMLVLFLALAVVKGFALVDAITRRSDAFPAADKQTKVMWLWILALAFAAHVILPSPLGILSLLGTVAAFVYLLDVRPALAEVTGRR